MGSTRKESSKLKSFVTSLDGGSDVLQQLRDFGVCDVSDLVYLRAHELRKVRAMLKVVGQRKFDEVLRKMKKSSSACAVA